MVSLYMKDDLLSPVVSIIIPCRNEATHIVDVLTCLLQQEFGEYEIIIVEDGSTDNTHELIEAWRTSHPEVNLRMLVNQAGTIPGGLNEAIQVANGPVIARLDGHALSSKTYLRRAVELLRQPDAGVVGGPIDVVAGGVEPIAKAIAIAVSTPLGAGDAAYRTGGSQLQKVDTVPFGCFRRHTWDLVGGYQSQLSANEDYEFNFRVRAAGLSIYLDPAMRCTYFARSTLSALTQQYWRYGWWKARMLQIHPSSLKLRQLIPILWVAIGALLILFAGWPLVRLAAILAWGGYLLLIIVVCTQKWTGDWRLWISLAQAYIAIHFSWGLGFWASIVTSIGQLVASFVLQKPPASKPTQSG